ncbi:serine/threonine-protein kinase [Lipingzhangella halophila]|uniref:non-specific serine/threonine protein kinase n=1 Tax=Lipingzhangella halophila TaxID=1783352 RepID=A0A7W7RP22_9ACTN|nr:protein kinase [Lipingzhangella halophila]MBB4935555.1 serine/threonine-protein kinase [Lipingzhangella halophila]
MSEHDTGAPGPHQDLAGLLLSDRYRLDEQIGSGGMGTVWRATDTLLNRPVAVKLLHPAQMAQPTSRERFRTEGRITAGLSHPGIAQVFDYGEQDDNAYLIMELVPGEPLSSILRRKGALEPGATLDIIVQAAQALGAAHARGVVHRDMKPGNLLVTENGDVKLTDFGIARGNESVTLTQTGMVMGTAQYISPEQASGGSASYASDIYALGVVAYECLAGRPPFTADTPLALALAHTREPPPPLPEEVPPQLRAFVERLLEKSPEQRASSAGEVAQTAQQLRGGIGNTDSTTAMDLADPGQTMVASANPGDAGPSTRPTSQGTGASAGAGSRNGGGSSDRVAEEPGPNRRPSLPVVFAVVAAAVVLVGGVVLAGWLWGGNNPEETVGDRQPDSETSSSPTNEPEPEEPDPEPNPGLDEQQGVPEQPQPDTSESPPQDPTPETNVPPEESPQTDNGEQDDSGDDGNNEGEDDNNEGEGDPPPGGETGEQDPGGS